MESILTNRPALAAEVEKVAETAGYLWQKGWAERNGTGHRTKRIRRWAAKNGERLCLSKSYA